MGRAAQLWAYREREQTQVLGKMGSHREVRALNFQEGHAPWLGGTQQQPDFAI